MRYNMKLKERVEMDVFSWLFENKANKKNTVETLKRELASSEIRYDSSLVTALKDDHQQLLRMYVEIKQNAEAGQYERIGLGLRDFKHALQSHLVVENIRFYVYLQQYFASDMAASSLISDLRHDMDGIANAVIRFIYRYEYAEFNAEMIDKFLSEFAEIGKVLVQRIQTEESKLYTIYMPKY